MVPLKEHLNLPNNTIFMLVLDEIASYIKVLLVRAIFSLVLAMLGLIVLIKA